jgi:hypothetical protein
MSDLWKRISALAFVVVLALGGVPVSAQSNLGSIVGTINDESGAVVQGATVTVTNLATRISRTFETDVSGSYEITHLVAGSYAVTVERAGFKRAAAETRLDAGSKVRVNLELALGAIEATVTVGERAPAIETETGSIAQFRTQLEYRTLPILQNNEPYKILASLPNLQSGDSKFRFSIAGSRTGQVEFQQDGISGPNEGSPQLSGSMTMEGTREIRLQAVNNSAEYGAPGIFQMVSRSGGNDIHGGAHYYARDNRLNARDFFDDKTKPKPTANSKSFGGTVSGPVRLPFYDGRNRTFFMIAYDGNRASGSTTVTNSLPTVAMKNGDFSALRTSIVNPFTGQPFPGNQIPASLLSPVSLKIQQIFFPDPNTGAAGALTNNYQVLRDTPGSENITDIRIDHRLSASNSFFVKAGQRRFPSKGVPSVPTVGLRHNDRKFRNIIFSDIHTFSSHVINEFRFGHQAERSEYHGSEQRGLDVVRAIGLRGLESKPDREGMPIINITGLTALTPAGDSDIVDVHNLTQFTDSVTWIHRRHTWKGGIDVRHSSPNQDNAPNGVFGDFRFQGNFTGQPYADFLLGIPTQAVDVPVSPKSGNQVTDWNLFLQDDFRISRRLTLNLGLRYEYQQGLTTNLDRQYNFDPQTGQIVVPSSAIGGVDPFFNKSVPIVTAPMVGFPDGQYRFPDKNNVVPRLGFAFRLSDRTVVRGAYGIYIDTLGTGNIETGGPFSVGTFSYVNSVQNGVPLFQFPNAFPGAQSARGPSTSPPSLRATDPRLRNPHLQQWNLSLEREWLGMGVRVSYIGTKNSDLIYARNINLPQASTTAFSQSRRPYPLYGDINYRENGAGSIYHALQVDAQRRFSHGLSYTLAYTFANNISEIADAGGDGGGSLEDPYNFARERAREAYSIRHRMIGSLIWELPVGHGRRLLSSSSGVLQQILGGWQLSALGFLQTGEWFTPTFAGSDPSNTGRSGGRPDRIGDGNLPGGQRTIEHWFDPTAFAIPPNGRYGTAGRNIIEGPGTQVLHLGLGKFFRLAGYKDEGVKLHVEVAAQNALNHANFANPRNGINSADPGKITSTVARLEQGNARVVEIRARLLF